MNATAPATPAPLLMPPFPQEPPFGSPAAVAAAARVLTGASTLADEPADEPPSRTRAEVLAHLHSENFLVGYFGARRRAVTNGNNRFPSVTIPPGLPPTLRPSLPSVTALIVTFRNTHCAS